MGRVSEVVIDRLRCELFNKLNHLPAIFYDHNNSGEISSKLIYNINLANKIIGRTSLILIQNTPLFICPIRLLILAELAICVYFLHY